MSFFLEFLKHPRRIGAVAPSSAGLSAKMVDPIDFLSAKVIVEYGPGTGVFTRELVIRRRPETVLILIEQNENFCKRLSALFCNQPNFYVIHGSAEHVNRHLTACGVSNADYIVSGLPFTSLPASVSATILRETGKALDKKGMWITFQYSLVKKKTLEESFMITGCQRVIRNIPPAYVLSMKNYDPARMEGGKDGEKKEDRQEKAAESVYEE